MVSYDLRVAVQMWEVYNQPMNTEKQLGGSFPFPSVYMYQMFLSMRTYAKQEMNQKVQFENHVEIARAS